MNKTVKVITKDGQMDSIVIPNGALFLTKEELEELFNVEISEFLCAGRYLAQKDALHVYKTETEHFLLLFKGLVSESVWTSFDSLESTYYTEQLGLKKCYK